MLTVIPLTPGVGFWERVLIFILFMSFIISMIYLVRFLYKNLLKAPFWGLKISVRKFFFLS